MIIIFILKTLLTLLVTLFVLGFVLVNKAKQSKYKDLFNQGELPANFPDGFYRGFSDLPTGPWVGKRFDSATNTGINIFELNGKRLELFPLQMSKGKGLSDPDLDVIKIDYNNPKNFFFVRPVLDEIVETEPGKFLGKIHYRYAKNKSFVLGYFQQEK